jgi:hypothetical protein
MKGYTPLKSYEGLYWINKKGKIKNQNGEIIKPFINEDNYLRITLYKNGRKRNYYIHKLVCQTFHKPIKGKKFVNHIDLNRQNNHYLNLEFVSHKENCNKRSNNLS